MTLSYNYLGENLRLLEKLGFPENNALDAIGLEIQDLALGHKRLPLETFAECLNSAAEYLQDRYVGLRVGYKFRVANFGQTGVLYSFCRNLEEVMMMNNLYQKVAIDAGGIEYVHGDAGEHLMCFNPFYADANQFRAITDMIIAAYVTTYRWLSWGSGEEIVAVNLPYIQSGDKPAYETILKTRVQQTSDRISIEFTDIAMGQKFPTHNPERLARARILLDRLIGQHTVQADFDKAVDASIRGAIAEGQVSTAIIATRMGLSVADLRKRLVETGEGIRPRIENVRKALFVEKINSGLSFSEIAFELAYNDQAAMNRAFKRWFGMTPTEWREKRSSEHPIT